MTSAGDWEGSVGTSWAAEWRRTDRSFAALTPRLLEATLAHPANRVLDIGCGAGEIALSLARARPQATVIGLDLSAPLLAVARSRGEGLGNLWFEQGDAARWVDTAGKPDLLVSRHGVMFFDDPAAAFAHLAAVAAPQARLVFTCFRSAAENAWAADIARLLPPAPPVPTSPSPAAFDPPPGPFAFADPERVRRALAGWRDIEFTPVDFTYVAGSGEAPVEDALAFFQRIGPAAAAIRNLPRTARASFEAKLDELVRSRLAGGQVIFPAAAWLVTATADHAAG
ncbi:class I SAM-dependent methyltransferase [Novosphingobium olei]|uniref:Methyltransferase domain-containing protein n=1 Tax=Novosphingobium olei TaxID=2728851 RepID=A0A7Y0G9Z2_9SPHN|nr:class I SAM-dependent methyltransferase [Novosphingobium olei]NML93339.1 methyltransferase domain-containing protein [Novosphingobium olei]